MSIGFGGAATDTLLDETHGSRITRTAGAREREPLERAFKYLLLAGLAIGLVTLGALLAQVLIQGWPRLNWDLIERYASSRPARAGARSAVLGTLYVIAVTAAVTLPLGVAAAVYLDEYADRSRWHNRLIELNIQNLAAVPSIVYGLLGLAFLVRGYLSLGPTVLAGGLTLALLVLPIVILASREAIRAVPKSIRDGSLALGATRWQTTWRQVLPAAVPGIATGSILALSRAIGEAAPVLLISGITFITFDPTGLGSAFTTLPLQIYAWVGRPQEEFRVIAAAAIVVLLVVLLCMNSAAIWIRNRYSRKW